MKKLKIILEKDEDYYLVYVPSLKGCHTQGKTRVEALKNIREAIELYLEFEEHEKISDEDFNKFIIEEKKYEEELNEKISSKLDKIIENKKWLSKKESQEFFNLL